MKLSRLQIMNFGCIDGLGYDIAIDRIVAGKIAEEWVYFNVLDILQPLGFTLAPPRSLT